VYANEQHRYRFRLLQYSYANCGNATEFNRMKYDGTERNLQQCELYIHRKYPTKEMSKYTTWNVLGMHA